MTRYANQHHLEQEAGPTVRPLQGLQPNKRGSSWAMRPGDSYRTLVDVRSETNDAELLTASVGAVPNGEIISSGSDADLVGRITWGIGGANFEAIIDINNGVTFSLPASYLRIDVAYNSDAPDGQPFQVSAGVGYGSMLCNSSPTRRTLNAGVIEASGLAVMTIPAWATSFTLLTIDDAGNTAILPNLFIEQLNTGSVMGAHRYTQDSNTGAQREVTYPLANGARFLQIVNLDNTNDIDVRVVFNLSF